ncbi:MAG: hypothetical protein AABX55_01320 [Nanoarchaeota archaeon]
MAIYVIGHNMYEFRLNTVEKKIFIYENDCMPQKWGFIDGLPLGYTWETVENIFKKRVHDKETSELALKLSEMFEKSLEEKIES